MNIYRERKKEREKGRERGRERETERDETEREETPLCIKPLAANLALFEAAAW